VDCRRLTCVLLRTVHHRIDRLKTRSGYGRLLESPPSCTTWRLRQRDVVGSRLNQLISTDGREAAVLSYPRRSLLNCSANLLVSHVTMESECSPRRMEPTRCTGSCLARLFPFEKCAEFGWRKVTPGSRFHCETDGEGDHLRCRRETHHLCSIIEDAQFSSYETNVLRDKSSPEGCCDLRQSNIVCPSALYLKDCE